jgi:hypothetical protein
MKNRLLLKIKMKKYKERNASVFQAAKKEHLEEADGE